MNLLRLAAAMMLMASLVTVFAYAAGLGTFPELSLAATDAQVLSCDTDGIVVSFGPPVYDPGIGYKVDEVTVSGIKQPDCGGGTTNIKLVISDSSGNLLGEEKSLVNGVTSVTFPFGFLDIAVTDVAEVHVLFQQ